MNLAIAIGAASGAWFVAAGVLFFNPVVDRMYRTEEGHPAVRVLPQNAGTIGRILAAILVQTTLWALIYQSIATALPSGVVPRGLAFGGIIAGLKLVPRDVDRILLTTYPARRMTIEFIIGLPCALVVGLVFAALL